MNTFLAILSAVGFVAGPLLVFYGIRKRNRGRFSLREWLFEERTLASSSGNQLIGEGIIAILVSVLLLAYAILAGPV